jgi:acyl carrier protein
MYKTGDLGRWRGDGRIEFLGRNDFQVKVRGFRIELGEIEARLAEYPNIQEAVVIAREDVAGDKRLVAYYTAKEAVEESVNAVVMDAEALRTHLSSLLPDYMVPAAYVRMERLPLTPNGKLDRKGLPAPESDAYGVREYEAPQGEIETQLAAIWAELLKAKNIGRRDNFFALGGHSLLVIRVVSSVRSSLGVELAIQTVFEAPSVAELAKNIEGLIFEQIVEMPEAEAIQAANLLKSKQ